MSQPVIILGAGGHARVLADALGRAGVAILGCTTPDREAGSEAVGVGPILGDDESLLDRDRSQALLVNGVGSVTRPDVRASVFDRHKRLGFDFAEVIDPWARVGSRVELGEGVQILAGAVVQTGSRLGRNVLINTSAGIDHDCFIGDHVHVAPGATLSGGVAIGSGSHIGVGATIVQGVSVGPQCMVGAGAVVTADVPAGSTVLGVPARLRPMPPFHHESA